jgi:predicted dehydrogenase
MLRGAMLGTGSISIHHMQAWQAIPHVEMVALANRTKARAEALARETDLEVARIYSDYRELLANETLDFVDIATAPHIHRGQVLAAAEAGIHVLCQKPFATSVNEAVEMIEACERAGVRCVVNENWRWRRWYRELKSTLDQGVIGTPHYARIERRGPALLPEAPVYERQSYIADMPRLLIFEMGIHFVDIMRFLFGDFSRIYAHTQRISSLVKGEDEALVMLEFVGNDVLGLIDMSAATYIPEEKLVIRGNLDYFVIVGDAGTIELNPFQDDVMIVTTAQGTERRPARPSMTPAEAYQESYLNTQSHFIHCLRSGQPAENEARDNLKTFSAAMAAYESAERKEWVDLSREERGSQDDPT